MKRVLFVINKLHTGGVPSSLESIYNNICDNENFDMHVLTLSSSGARNFTFCRKIIPTPILLDLYMTRLSDSSSIPKYRIVLFKPLKMFLETIGINLKKIIYKKAVNYIEKKCIYDYIVSFQDRATAEFCRFFNSTEKIAWIHCDYPKLLAQEGDVHIFNDYKRIICVSRYTMNCFKTFYPILSSRVDYIYNLVDVDRIIKLSNEPIFEKLFDHKSFNIISIGRVAKVKRFNLIPYIANKLISCDINFKWYILGAGDKEYMNEINNDIVKYNLSGTVICLGNQSNPYNYLKESDLFVSLSETEACPMVFNEARILNVPILSADFGSSFEFINDGVDGIISPIEDIDKELIDIITSSNKYQIIKQASANRIVDNNQIMNKFLNLFEI